MNHKGWLGTDNTKGGKTGSDKREMSEWRQKSLRTWSYDNWKQFNSKKFKEGLKKYEEAGRSHIMGDFIRYDKKFRFQPAEE